MKIERPKIMNATESTTAQETSTEPVQVQAPLPKADSVELKTNSFYNFENAPKLDSSKADLANQIPAAMLPGVAFREKVELAKTLPNGSSVNSGVANGDLGLGKTRPGVNHFGIDLNAGATGLRTQLDDALKLHQGSQSSVQVTGLNRFNLGKDWSHLSAMSITKEWGNDKEGGYELRGTNDKGFTVIGTETWKVGADGVTTRVYTETVFDKVGNSRTTTGTSTHATPEASAPIDDVWVKNYDKDGKLTDSEHTYKTPEGKRTDHFDANGELQNYDVGKMEDGIYVERHYDADGTYTGKTTTSNDGKEHEYDKDGNEIQYVNPDADPVTVSPEDAERALNARFSSNKTPLPPGTEEGGGSIVVDASKDYNPLHKPFVTDPVDGYKETLIPNLESIEVKNNAEGPDSVNPNDPDAAPPDPPKQ